jgi:hypothetical protein
VKKKQREIRVGRCVWCGAISVVMDKGQEGIDQALKDHVVKECKKHPMRRLERKIKRLEKK